MVPPPGLELVRRVEITVEEHWVSGVVPSPAASERQAPPESPKETMQTIERGNHARN
jgi:hypothetical protein